MRVSFVLFSLCFQVQQATMPGMMQLQQLQHLAQQLEQSSYPAGTAQQQVCVCVFVVLDIGAHLRLYCRVYVCYAVLLPSVYVP